jgi:hypothetical protein
MERWKSCVEEEVRRAMYTPGDGVGLENRTEANASRNTTLAIEQIERYYSRQGE